MMCISAIYVKECLKFSLKSRNIQEGLQIKDEPGWISMKISDILLHTLDMYTQRLCKCYMRFDYFQLFWFPILKNGFCHTILEGVPITYPLSLLDL
jgi:hypothetical protein